MSEKSQEDAFAAQIRAMMANNPQLAQQMVMQEPEADEKAYSQRNSPKTWCMFCPTVIFQANCATRDDLTVKSSSHKILKQTEIL
jgi:hypothetical protein